MRPRCIGIDAQVSPEYASESFRNQHPSAAGIDAQVTPEYLLSLGTRAAQPYPFGTLTVADPIC